MTGKVFEALIDMKETATNREKQLIASLLEFNPDDLIYISITELAEAANVAEATILRLCRKLGYRGFQDFKLKLSQDLGAKNQRSPESIMQKTAYSMMRVVEKSAENIDERTVYEIADMIVKSKRVCFFGVGSSNLPACAAQHRLLKAGINVETTPDNHMQSVITANLTKDDLVVLVSVSGSTIDILELKKIADKTGVKTAVITCYERSPLAKSSKVVLCNKIKEAASEGGILSTVVSQVYMIDAICAAVFNIKGEEADISAAKASYSVSDKLL